MKYKITAIVLAVCLLVLGGCVATMPEAEPVTFEALVLRADASSCEVQPIADTPMREEGDLFTVFLPDECEIISEDAEKDLQSGTRVEITFDGKISNGYPAQITALSVKILSQPTQTAAEDEQTDMPQTDYFETEETNSFITAELVEEVPVEARPIPSDELGEDILLRTTKQLDNIEISRVHYDESIRDYVADTVIWTSEGWNEGTPLHIRLAYTMEEPSMAISWEDEFGQRERRLICLSHMQDGKNVEHIAWLMHYVVPLAPTDITAQMPYYYDVDTDASKEKIELVPVSMEGKEPFVALRITRGTDVYERQMELTQELSCWIADMDGESGAEVYVSGKSASGESRLYLCRFDANGIRQIPISRDEAKRDSFGEKYLIGQIETIEERILYANADLSVFGSHAAQMMYSYADDEVSSLDGFWSIRSQTPVKTIRALPVTMDDGTQRELPAGTELSLRATDAVSMVMFETSDGERGTITITKNVAGGWYIAGRADTLYFEGLGE